MINEGDRYTVKIESIASCGFGVSHIDGFAVFVRDAVTGDVADVEITEVKKRFAYARIVELIQKSPHRIENRCSFSKLCGGCDFGHVEYLHQLDTKKEIVENAIRRIGAIADFELDEIIGCKKQYGYRNKVVFAVDDDRIGYNEKKSHRVLEIEECLLFDKINKDIIRAIKGKTNGIKKVFLRIAKGKVMVVLYADTLNIESTIVKSISDVSENIVSIILRTKKEQKILYGTDRLIDEILGVRFEISPDSFFQVNPEQTEVLYKKAIEFADIKKDDFVMDIYCGIGTISLIAARNAKKVIGIEIVDKAIEDARENARINGIENAKFFADSADKIVPKLIESGEKPDIVILDPPRSGSDEKTLGAILEVRPKRIVYVSCNPSTLARDLKFLCGDTYKITASTAVDMFPQTEHVETVVLMSRN